MILIMHLGGDSYMDEVYMERFKCGLRVAKKIQEGRKKNKERSVLLEFKKRNSH